jgi:transcriptional regulator with XRE-family HTH domain
MRRIEKGERLPSLELFLRIVQVLEADPTALLREAAAGLRGASRGLSRARAGPGPRRGLGMIGLCRGKEACTMTEEIRRIEGAGGGGGG